MKIVITSGSAHKKSALEMALKKFRIKAEIIAMKGLSDVNEQPIGFEETYMGAWNRIINCGSTDEDLVISIENGVFVIRESVKDFAIVLVMQDNGHTAWEISQTVTFPRKQYDKAKLAGFELHTVGSLLESDGVVKDGTDPHLELAGRSRKDIMCDTIVSCFTQLGFK